MPKVHAVTGAFGFSGKYITMQLLEKGHRVITLTGSPKRPDPFNGQVKTRPFRFDNVQAMARELSDVAVLYNTYWVRFNHRDFSYAEAMQNTITLFKGAKLAGVEKIVHISVTNANENSSLEYFRSKGVLERILRESGLPYAILRPATVFGHEDTMFNNMAWSLRKFPVFAIFGNGQYHIQPIYVEDLARIAVEQGQETKNTLIHAVGPENLTYLEFVKTMCALLGIKRTIITIPPVLCFLAGMVIGKIVNDVFVTREEIEAIVRGYLEVSEAVPTGNTRISDWIRDNANTLGRTYFSELARRKDRKKPYMPN